MGGYKRVIGSRRAGTDEAAAETLGYPPIVRPAGAGRSGLSASPFVAVPGDHASCCVVITMIDSGCSLCAASRVNCWATVCRGMLARATMSSIHRASVVPPPQGR